MIMRVWRARVDAARAAEYERFAREVSLPMFRDQPGFRGSLFGRSGAECVVVTVWDDSGAADSLDVSARYVETVSRIRAAGFMSVEFGAERFEVHAAEGLGEG